MNNWELPTGFDKTEIRKKLNKILKQAKEQSKPETCLICNETKTSFCNSHSVPRMILSNIAEDGMVLQPNAIIGIEVVDVKKGINNTGTFHYICNDCDSKLFKNYENPDILKQENISDKVLSEIALKDIVLVLSKRNQERSLYKILGKTGRLSGLDVMFETQDLDVRDFMEDMHFHLNISEKSKGNYQIIYHKILPYVVPIATQTGLVLYKDLENQIVNDIYDYSENERMQNLHLGIFPLQNETVVLLFHAKKDKNYRKVRHQFNCISESKKLEYINYLVFKYTENYYFSPSIRQVIENDNNLSLLSRENNDLPNLGFKNFFDNSEYKTIEPGQITNLLLEEYSINKQ